VVPGILHRNVQNGATTAQLTHHFRMVLQCTACFAVQPTLDSPAHACLQLSHAAWMQDSIKLYQVAVDRWNQRYAAAKEYQVVAVL
jgi:hypothetical protein